MYYQQGDVIIEAFDGIVEGKKKDNLILADGEATGHCHKISDGLAELFETGNTKYLRIKSDTATLTHDEHKPITLPKGDYRVRIVREYDHFQEESRLVRD